jgi:phospholipase/carboxylesterase
MIYKYIEKNKDNLIILFHGTGGDENSLITLASYIDDNASVLGIRGNVNEHGMNRYFKRIRPGVFDELNLLEETKKIKIFIDDFVNNHNYKLKNIIMIGYSNGANIIGSLLYLFGKISKGVCLMHPMIPLQNVTPKDLCNINILITSGISNQLVSGDETNKLFEIFKNNNGNIDITKYNNGHQISQKEIDDIKNWYINILN